MLQICWLLKPLPTHMLYSMTVCALTSSSTTARSLLHNNVATVTGNTCCNRSLDDAADTEATAYKPCSDCKSEPDRAQISCCCWILPMISIIQWVFCRSTASQRAHSCQTGHTLGTGAQKTFVWAGAMHTRFRCSRVSNEASHTLHNHPLLISHATQQLWPAVTKQYAGLLAQRNARQITTQSQGERHS